jgi:cytochrome c oxidase accessory protein FixG
MEIPKDRLSTTDSFGDRVSIYPAAVKGFWRRHRNWTQFVLLAIFLCLPWFRIGGEQTLLFSIPERRFAIFGLRLYAHDGPMIFFVLAIAVFGLALLTALWGRVWCGWGCPQTVFIDGLFRRIESLIEGNHLARRQRDAGPLTLNKFLRKSIKWILFTIASTVIAHSLTAYFVGAKRLAQMSLHAPEDNWVVFLIVFSLSLILLFNFGWFREQFCIIMCPYGRFQSVLMDKHSLAVMYDDKRGEPRKGLKEKHGDCVNCERCIMVCPTRIDIRRGIQLECINCTACIDACDEIMEKVHKPKGLIRYTSIAKLEGKKTHWLNFRRTFYIVLITVALVGLSYKIATRSPLRVEVLRVVGAPYRILEGPESGMIINQFKLHLQNQTPFTMKLKFFLSGKDDSSSITLIEQDKEVQIQPGELTNHFLFIKFNRNLTKALGQTNAEVNINYEYTSVGENTPKVEVIKKSLKLLGPLEN